MINFETTKNTTLMKRLLLFSIAIILILCSCNYNNETRQKLVLADTLLYHTKNDSAMKVLKSINAEDLKDESDKAYYNLLMTQTRHVLYMTPMPDSIINGCIEYTQNTTMQSNSQNLITIKVQYYATKIK